MKKLPEIRKENGISTLFVDGSPFIAFAGELHNSSSSSLQYMEKKVWPNLRHLNLNTVLAPVCWNLFEPSENEFDFTLIDGIIAQARDEKVRLVPLWFGLWKNSFSTYTPDWVKKDYNKYFRACYPTGELSCAISPLCGEAVSADAKAFKILLRHIREIDGDENTVIMVQVENEMGLLACDRAGCDRDFSDTANREFNKQIPSAIAEAFGRSGTWSEAFGGDAGEYFMAYHYAVAVEQIARAGAAEYPLPMYVNAWLEQFPKRAGAHPSGGPTAKMMKVWQTAAPSICLLAPDIYLPDFAAVCEEYTAGGNPLFIPEARRDVVSATNVFYAIGNHHALCFSPFGIEDFAGTSNDDIYGDEMLAALNIDVSASVINGTGYYLAQSYKLLANMSGIICKYRGTEHLKGFLQNNDNGCILSFSKYDLKLTYLPVEPDKPIGGGLILELSENKFILAGTGFSPEFLPKSGQLSIVDYIRVEEGTFKDGNWIKGRTLNGDEAFRLTIGRNPSVLFIEVYKYPVRYNK